MIERDDVESVRVLYFSNPPSNVLNLEMLEFLRVQVLDAGSDPQVRCLLLASKVTKYFSSGLDLEELTRLPPERQSEPFNALLAAYLSIYSLPKPTVACLNGNAILGGWIIALACDFRLLQEDSRVALSEIRFGLSPTSLLISRMREIASSQGLVREMVLRGKAARAQEALAGGLVDMTCKPETIFEDALKEARLLSKQSPLAYASVKRSLQEGVNPNTTQILWKKSADEFRALFTDPQTQEGIAAMRDKRTPRWAE